MRRKLSAFRADRRGIVLYLVALLLVPFCILLGVAVDVGQLLVMKTRLQAALDSAALDIAGTPGIAQSQAGAQAQNFTAANLSSQEATATISNLSAVLNPSGTPPSVTVQATVTVNTFFLQIAGPSYATLSSALSSTAANGAYSCVLQTAASASPGVNIQSGGKITLDGCDLIANSTSSESVYADHGSHFSGNSIYATGQVDQLGGSQVSYTGGIYQNQSATPDPYASVPMPAQSGCDHTCTNKSGCTPSGNPVPGNAYCGSWTFSGSLAAGTYFVKGNSYGSALSFGSLTGTDVTIVLTTSDSVNYAYLNVTNAANVTLSAPTSGPVSGIVLFGDRNAPLTTTSTFGHGSKTVLTGAIYLPSQSLFYEDGSSVTSPCTQIIAGQITFTGGSKLSINCDGTGALNFGKGPYLMN
ncbi:MAG: TadE/TadG family type IV pilus assembly protein [Rhodomicrobium sp.]